MAYRGPAPAAGGRTRWPVVAALVLVSAPLIGVLVDRSSATSGDDARAMPTFAPGPPPPPAAPSRSFAPGPPDRLPRDQQGGLSEADGVVPEGVTVFDDEYPAVARLDPALRVALRQAAMDAAREGIKLFIDSGWRSAK